MNYAKFKSLVYKGQVFFPGGQVFFPGDEVVVATVVGGNKVTYVFGKIVRGLYVEDKAPYEPNWLRVACEDGTERTYRADFIAKMTKEEFARLTLEAL